VAPDQLDRPLSPLAEPLLEPPAAAKLLSVKTSWVYEAVRSGRLPHLKVGRHIRFLRSDLEEWGHRSTHGRSAMTSVTASIPSPLGLGMGWLTKPWRSSVPSASAWSSAAVSATPSVAEFVFPAHLPGCAPRSLDVEGPWCAAQTGMGAGQAVSKVSTRGGRTSGHPSRRRGRVTDRDRAILTWLARQRFTTADVIAARFGMDRSRTYRRLRILAAARLVEHHRIFHGPGVYLATAHGIAVADLALPPAKIDIRSYHHDLGLAALCAHYELAGHRVLTEREIRTADSFSPTPRYAVPLGDRHLHFPDLIINERRGLVAIELERTAKRARRLDQILGAYMRARHLAAVRYHATSPALERWLSRAVARTRADALVEVVGPDHAHLPSATGEPITEEDIT